MLTPKQQGFFLPAEWEQHKATWLAWPYDTTSFPDRVAKVEQVYASIIYYLHKTERIELLILDKAMQNRTLSLLKQYHIDLNKVIFHIIDYADVWTRDYGPIFLINKEHKSAWTKWQYNAYGKKFPELLKDDKVAYQLQDYINLPNFQIDMVLEGGAIETNGQGLLLTTEQCLLNPNRNNLIKSEIEQNFRQYLGIKEIIWLKQGVINDHTDGHIDQIARFVNQDTVAVAYEDDKKDPNFAILDANYRILQNYHFNLIKLPMPKMHYEDGSRAPVSYTNFYIANELVLVPQFKDQQGKVALDIIQSLFPERKAIGIDCTDLIYGGGAVHCITREQPM
jgi:agmatine deiminase